MSQFQVQNTILAYASPRGTVIQSHDRTPLAAAPVVAQLSFYFHPSPFTHDDKEFAFVKMYMLSNNKYGIKNNIGAFVFLL